MTTTDHPTPPPAPAALRVFGEDWDPSYGSPATFDWDDSGSVEQVEDGVGHVAGRADARVPLAFVDGVRRAEMRLWAEDGHGVRVPGLAGAYAVGAVTVRPGMGADFSGERVGRLAVWGHGHCGDLLGSHGFRWASESTTADEPDELLLHLHERMRRAEGTLALAAAEAGWHTVLDGPLNRIPGVHGLVTGYVKTHRRRLLPDDEHARVPALAVGERTRLYTNGATHYTCYVRVGSPGPAASPWSGVARLHFPAVAGFDAVLAEADVLAGTLPAFAGVAHRDPRAPVNLTPVRNLERHLTHALGSAKLARRAARDALLAGAGR